MQTSPAPAIRPPVPAGGVLADGLSDPTAAYLACTFAGLRIREVARARGCAPSTVLRQIRKVERWREEDPLVDAAIERVGRGCAGPDDIATIKDLDQMQKPAAAIGLRSVQAERPAPRPEAEVEREARRILRRLCEKGAFLAVAPTMEKAVVLREVVPGRQNRIAVVDREVAYAFALRDWIGCERAGKIACYAITAAGRAALKRLLTEERLGRGPKAAGFAEAASPFQEQHRFYAERTVTADDGSGARRLRFNLADSPLLVLGRKRDKDGTPYLTAELIEAGERLREDFELAQIGPRVAQNWERFLTAGSARGATGQRQGEGPTDARARVAKALEALGPGLSDIVFRICCFLEGLETAERRLGWSSRSGKVVLKIALERLAAHYRLRPPASERAAG